MFQYGQYVFVQVQLTTGVALDRHLSVMINAPSSLIVGRADDASGQIVFNVEETGKSLYKSFMWFKQHILFCVFVYCKNNMLLELSVQVFIRCASATSTIVLGACRYSWTLVCTLIDRKTQRNKKKKIWRRSTAHCPQLELSNCSLTMHSVEVTS